jgi:hypothetical protein
MIALSSTADVLGALSTAGRVDVLAYTLRRGAVFDGLEAAARRGAHVRVRLEGAPYGDPNGSFARENRVLADELSKAGIDAQLARVGPCAASDAPVHAKAIVADGSLFLDDRNWGSADFVVRDDRASDAHVVLDAVDGVVRSDPCPSFAIEKRDALEREAELLRSSKPGDDVVVESESFGYANPVFAALGALGKSGAAPRLLVSSREVASNARERKALERLAGDGVAVRLCRDSEKFALAGRRAWIGSANASPDFGTPDMLDWGVCTDDPTVVAAARAAVEARWNAAKPFTT